MDFDKSLFIKNELGTIQENCTRTIYLGLKTNLLSLQKNN